MFSNNLDDKFELALSNEDVIYEVDWSDIENPYMISKYSLMPNSTVTQIFLNNRFVFAQANSKSASGDINYHYTWVLTRGSRTYTNAFHVMNHSTEFTRIDLNADESFLIIMDNERLTNYALDEPYLSLKLPKDEDLLDRIMQFKILGTSSEPSLKDNNTHVCNITINFTLL